LKEQYEFRVLEKYAPLLFADGEGKRGILARIIKIDGDDPRLPIVGDLDKKIHLEASESFFYGWDIVRRYTSDELASARLFQLMIIPSAHFEPAGEECGTVYDESTACSRCGAGATQVGPLVLDLKRIPKGKDISRTIAGEVVVSKRVVDLFGGNGVDGVNLTPVHDCRSPDVESEDWFQLQIKDTHAELVPPTRAGINPFDDDESGTCRCATGDLIGLNLLSEVTISSVSRGQADFIASRQFVGVRRGLLRPQRIMLISAKVRELISLEKLKGSAIEVAHVRPDN
jgi:hypothetical protein